MSSTTIAVGLFAVIILFIIGGILAAFLIDRRRNQAVAHDEERFAEQPNQTDQTDQTGGGTGNGPA